MDCWPSPSSLQHTGYDLGRIFSGANRNGLHSTPKDDGMINAEGCGQNAYTMPTITLTSNDKQSLTQQRLAAKRANRRTLAAKKGANDRPYLRCQKYIEYRERKRQDIGKDGKPVWPDHVEASFQNALVWIPPMGRRKRPQNGKLHGRNELIAEWIFQETGEIRHRKQISSHIQVLNDFLKYIPEWQAITKPKDTGNDEHKDDAAYYSDSIADIVRCTRHLSVQSQNAKNPSQREQNSNRSARHHLTKLRFDMWAARSDKIHDAIHNYTRVHQMSSPARTMPLEDFRSWRQCFPDLEALLQTSTSQSFDLILLKSGVNLMSDFPPPDSKLGLVIELDFRHETDSNLQALNDITLFSCTNKLYQHGKLFHEKHHERCKVSEVSGVAKPFFEVEWWASHFTKLTEKKKTAEHDRGDSTLATAAKLSQDSLYGLTMMQVIDGWTGAGKSSHVSVPKRMAVLLWTFSQSPDKSPGVTQWYKLIPPPNRSLANSPPAPSRKAYPPLTLNSTLDTQLAGNSFGTGQSGTDEMADSLLTSASIQDSSFQDFLPDNGELLALDPAWYLPINEIRMLRSQPELSPMDFYDTLESQAEQRQTAQIDNPLHSTNLPMYNMIQTNPSPPNFQGPLARFDNSTHNMLQAQLGTFDHGNSFSNIDPDISMDLYPTLPNFHYCDPPAETRNNNAEPLRQTRTTFVDGLCLDNKNTMTDVSSLNMVHNQSSLPSNTNLSIDSHQSDQNNLFCANKVTHPKPSNKPHVITTRNLTQHDQDHAALNTPDLPDNPPNSPFAFNCPSPIDFAQFIAAAQDFTAPDNHNMN